MPMVAEMAAMAAEAKSKEQVRGPVIWRVAGGIIWVIGVRVVVIVIGREEDWIVMVVVVVMMPMVPPVMVDCRLCRPTGQG